MARQRKKQDVQNVKSLPRSSVKGVVTSRKCRHCGHHEIGIVTEDGEYRALKNGMKIILIEE